MDSLSRKRGKSNNGDPVRRLQSSGDDDEEDAAVLAAALEGDGFVSPSEQQAREAQRRRERRKKLLEKAKQEEEQQVVAPTRAGKELSRSSSPAPKQSMNDASPDGKEGNGDNNNDDDDDSFDMFSSSVSPVGTGATADATAKSGTVASSSTSGGRGQEGDCDDAEGYYKAVIGESIRLMQPPTISSENAAAASSDMVFSVSGLVGKGVFSTVLKCFTTSNPSSVPIPKVVALKLIRHNETMAKAALSEIRMLIRLSNSPGIVPLLLPSSDTRLLEHRGHVVLAFPFMEYNLRDVLQKFGKGVGLSLQAVRSYFGQLLAAATHLKKHNVIHADLKPDNVLVSADYARVQIADFGSAMDASEQQEQQNATPYLVSRFYRAPEIILGLVPTIAIDLWSLAVTAVEMYLGKVLFQGQTNNDMLFSFMQHLGAVPNRVIRQHMVQSQKLALPKHFEQDGPTYKFTQQTSDPVSGQALVKVLPLVQTASATTKFPSASPIARVLHKAKSASDSRVMLNQFSDLCTKCMALDASRRISLKDALQHELFTAQTVQSEES